MNLRQLVERNDRPFASHPQVARYFPAASIEDARRRIARSIERGDGPCAVLGSAGTGKSLLLQVLAAQYREKFDIVLLACAQLCTRRALLQAIHFELGLDYRRRDEGELRLSLLDTLLSADESTQGLLLLVDEAQALAVHLLEELRLLTNLARGGVPRIRLVMAGLPSLEEKFAGPELQSFSQRLTARCYLAPLTRAETVQYVRAQLAASAAEAERLFAPAALDALFGATDGVPRLVNQVCDRALVLADARRLNMVDAAVIQAAWADLQQLPTPWEAPPEDKTGASPSPNVVEFGSLSGEPAKPSASPITPTTAFAERARIEDPEKGIAPSRPVSVTPVSKSKPRPRVVSENVPEAVDPFDEHFEDEELVLDSFATLASIFGARTPRVQNSREPNFARLVQHALDATEATATHEADTVDASDIGTDEPEIRLAVVADSTPDRKEQHRPPAAIESPVEPAAYDDRGDPILVIEEEFAKPSHTRPGVRRENYRQLFTRLRHGT